MMTFPREETEHVCDEFATLAAHTIEFLDRLANQFGHHLPPNFAKAAFKVQKLLPRAAWDGVYGEEDAITDPDEAIRMIRERSAAPKTA
jgi:hypothetical protein